LLREKRKCSGIKNHIETRNNKSLKNIKDYSVNISETILQKVIPIICISSLKAVPGEGYYE